MDWTNDQILWLNYRVLKAFNSEFGSEEYETKLGSMYRLRRKETFNYDLLHLTLIELGY